VRFLFILRFVKGILGNYDVIVLLIFVLIQVVATSPCENEEAKEAQQE
jgi:hypothetical protein